MRLTTIAYTVSLLIVGLGCIETVRTHLKTQTLMKTLHTFTIAALFVVALSLQRAAFGAQIISQDFTFDSSAGIAYFVITWNSARNFFTLDDVGRPADSFQIWINPPSAGPGLYPPANPYSNVLIRGDEIHVNNSIVLRNIGPPQNSDPNSGGWGPIIGSVPFSLSGDSTSFSVSMDLLGVTRAFNYDLEGYQYGAINCEDVFGAASVVPEPSTYYLAGAMLMVSFGFHCRRKLRKSVS